MTKYTIAERQALKDALAHEKFFEQDMQLFVQLFPHHAIVGECKRVNSINRLSLDRRMIYQMLAKVDQASIVSNRTQGIVKTKDIRNIHAAAVDTTTKALEWFRGKCSQLSKKLFNIRKPDC